MVHRHIASAQLMSMHKHTPRMLSQRAPYVRGQVLPSRTGVGESSPHVLHIILSEAVHKFLLPKSGRRRGTSFDQLLPQLDGSLHAVLAHGGAGRLRPCRESLRRLPCRRLTKHQRGNDEKQPDNNRRPKITDGGRAVASAKPKHCRAAQTRRAAGPAR